LTSFSGK